MNVPHISSGMEKEQLEGFMSKARAASTLLKALSHETRLLILCILSQGEKTVGEIETILGLQQAVVSQQLLPDVNGNLIPAFEIMLVNHAIRNMIRDGKTPQIDSAIQMGAPSGMMTMDLCLSKLVQTGRISRENALLHAISPEALQRYLTIGKETES